MCRIPEKFHDGFRYGMEEQGIQFLLVIVEHDVEFAWTDEHHMIIINVQYMLVLCIDPQLIRKSLAHRAESVTARVVVYLDMAALAASGNVHPVCPCLTVQDMVCRLCLPDIGGIFLHVSGVELPQDIPDSRFISHCRRPPSRLFQTC